MINIEDFVKRLEKILDYYSLSASAFADTVGIQRSGVSHLMSGRNKPSLDLVMKICESFPEVDLHWLLNGKGIFPKTDDATSSLPPAVSPSKITADQNLNHGSGSQRDLFSNPPENALPESEMWQSDSTENILDGDIERIVIFYKNGTFKSYNAAN